MSDLQQAIETWEYVRDEAHDSEILHAAGDDIVRAARELLAEPTNVQALALARLMRGRQGQSVRIFPGEAGALPNGWLLCDFDGGQIAGGFTCGIAPDGSVSS